MKCEEMLFPAHRLNNSLSIIASYLYLQKPSTAVTQVGQPGHSDVPFSLSFSLSCFDMISVIIKYVVHNVVDFRSHM